MEISYAKEKSGEVRKRGERGALGIEAKQPHMYFTFFGRKSILKEKKNKTKHGSPSHRYKRAHSCTAAVSDARNRV